MTAINGTASSHQFPGSFSDPSKHAQIYEYLEALKKDEQGWKKSADNIVTNNLSNVEEHFLLLQVVEDYLTRRYVSSTDNESTNCIRSLLSHWIQKLSTIPDQPGFLVNKMAHIFSLVFAADFPDRWPEFMNDIFLSRDYTSVTLAIFYLKTLLAIDAEVVDRDIQRTKQIFDRNTKIKDFMRDICIKQMVQSWFTILERVSDVTAQCLCLDVVAAFIDWIDVELVANDDFVPLIIARLGNKDTSESATHAVTALMQKGMPPAKKVPLVVALADVMHANNLTAVTPSSEFDDVLRAGSLLNCMGMVLMDCNSKFRAESSFEEAANCVNVLESNMDTILAVLNNDNAELSELVVDTVRTYVQFVRDDQGEVRSSVLSRIVAICLQRYAMGDDLEVDGEGEDELEFHEYRKELRSLLNAIGTKRPDLVIAPLELLVNEVLAGASSLPIQKIEAVVQLVYTLSELIPSNFMQAKEGWLARATQIPITLLTSLSLDGRSATVHVLFFEIACRYERLLVGRPQPVVSLVAAAFLDERGIAIPVQRVRTRIVYLFCRFVKSHKIVLSPLVSEVVQRLAPLLAVSPQAEQFLSADDQSFIFEATATLIIFGDLTVEQKVQFIQELVTNLATKFQSALTELQISRSRGDANTIKIVEQFMVNIIGYCSRISKAFNNTHSMRSCNCVDIFMTLLNMFLESLSPANPFLLEPTRQLAHRMVVCLDAEVLPILPILMTKLSSVSNDLDSMNQLLIFTHQVVAKHKKESLKSGVDFGIILTTAARYSVVLDASEATRSQDEAAQRNLLYVQRSFLQLMYTTAINNMLADVAGASIEDLLEATTRLALGSDQASQKLALQTLSKVASLNENWWARTLRVALEVPSLGHISPVDAGSTLVVHEVSNTLLALRQLNAKEFDSGVQSLLPAHMATSLLNLLQTTKSKELDKQIMLLYAQLKG